MLALAPSTSRDCSLPDTDDGSRTKIVSRQRDAQLLLRARLQAEQHEPHPAMRGHNEVNVLRFVTLKSFRRCFYICIFVMSLNVCSIYLSLIVSIHNDAHIL